MPGETGKKKILNNRLKSFLCLTPAGRLTHIYQTPPKVSYSYQVFVRHLKGVRQIAMQSAFKFL